MVDSGHSESEPEGLQRARVAADVAVAQGEGQAVYVEAARGQLEEEEAI
jgi:hypothetical protein